MNTAQLTVLDVDDDCGDAVLLQRNLEQIEGLQFNFLHVPTLADAQAALTEKAVDITFVDYRLGAGSGLDLLRTIRSGGDIRPMICLTGQGDERIAASIMQAGADDYLVKSDLNPHTLYRAIQNSSAQCQKRQLQEQNEQLLRELESKAAALEKKTQRLAEMYDAAHQFVDDVSHEFRTPLTVIKEFASILHDGLAGNITADQKNFLGIMLNRTDDLSMLVDDILDISKLEAGLLGIRRKVCDVRQIVNAVKDTLERKAAAHKIRFSVDIPEEIPLVYCDPEKIGRVLVNLAVNAFKFSREGSPVELWVRNDSDPSLVLMGLTDQGPGIHPESLTELFERFAQVGTTSRTAVKGFGLGLNIAKELVNINLGDINVESTVGVGSIFKFTIPVAEAGKLIRRYISRVGAFREGLAVASLIEAHIERDVPKELAETVEELVQENVRKTDLVFSIGPRSWLIVLTSNRPGAGVVGQRLTKAWADENRNRLGQPLPPIQLEEIGTWKLEADSDFTRRFETVLLKGADNGNGTTKSSCR